MTLDWVQMKWLDMGLPSKLDLDWAEIQPLTLFSDDFWLSADEVADIGVTEVDLDWVSC